MASPVQDVHREREERDDDGDWIADPDGVLSATPHQGA